MYTFFCFTIDLSNHIKKLKQQCYQRKRQKKTLIKYHFTTLNVNFQRCYWQMFVMHFLSSFLIIKITNEKVQTQCACTHKQIQKQFAYTHTNKQKHSLHAQSQTNTNMVCMHTHKQIQTQCAYTRTNKYIQSVYAHTQTNKNIM